MMVATLASCAGPPLKLYVRTPSSQTGALPLKPPRPGQNTIAVARLVLPDYLDTRDILVRSGNVVVASHEGRWASRLSLGATDFVTHELTQRLPDAWVADKPQAIHPNYRIMIDVTRFEVTVERLAVLESDWVILEVDTNVVVERNRGRFEATGSVSHDGDMVALQQGLLQQLGAALDVTKLR